MEKSNDGLVIKNGNILLFEPDRILEKHDIRIKEGKIVGIDSADMRGEKTIDAENKLVMPGFIDFHSHVDGRQFSAECLLRQGATTTIGGERVFDGLVVKHIDDEGFIINHGFYISHSFTLRQAVGIDDPYRAATSDEIDEMVKIAELFLKDGSFGIHFGLEFAPGTSMDELVELTKLVYKYDRVAVVHMRHDGFQSVEALNEVFEVCRLVGCRVHILHLLYMSGAKGIMDVVLEHIDQVRAEGLDITADTGLYGGYPTCIGSALLDGNLQNKYGAEAGPHKIIISSGAYSTEECTNEQFDFLRKEYPETLVTAFFYDESVVPKALKKPYVFVSTNAADGPHYEGAGHPETTGTFPKLIRKYVLEENILDMAEAVKKISILPARRFGIKGKGKIDIGYDADIVIMDPQNIRPKSDYIHLGDPNAPPDGIEKVLVNGEIIFENGIVYSNSRFGNMIRCNG